MSQVDVRDLAREGLAPGRFPADLRADFRVHMTPEVLRGIESHAKADHSVEICGVLVGGWGQDDEGPYATVTDYIRCDNAASKFAEVTFTHESWAQINKEMDSKYTDKRIVGWYHSHPDFGIFLSDRDCFIQQHFFSGAGQVAYVIDPVRDLEGVFAWRKGKPTPLPHFWAGDEIRMTQAAEDRPQREGRGGGAAGQGMSPEAEPAPRYAERPPAFSAMTLLAWAGLFLLGYFYSGLLSRVEEQKMMEGVIARFMNSKVLKLGLDKELQSVRQALGRVGEDIDTLPEPGAKLSKQELAAAIKHRKQIGNNFGVLDIALAGIESRYALTPEEQSIYAQLYAEQQAILRVDEGSPPAKRAKPKAPVAGGGSSTSDAGAGAPGPTGGATPGGATTGSATTGVPTVPAASNPAPPITSPAGD